MFTCQSSVVSPRAVHDSVPVAVASVEHALHGEVPVTLGQLAELLIHTRHVDTGGMSRGPRSPGDWPCRPRSGRTRGRSSGAGPGPPRPAPAASPAARSPRGGGSRHRPSPAVWRQPPPGHWDPRCQGCGKGVLVLTRTTFKSSIEARRNF